MKTTYDNDMRLFALAMAISATESRVRVRLTRSMILGSAAIVLRATPMDLLLTTSLVLTLREFIPGCIDLFMARRLRRAFGNVDCG
jgi:energy-converting hydrogenase Eha subunit C